MIGVSNSAPRLPVLVSVNVPPARSSGADLPGPGAGGQVGDLAGQAADVQVAGLLDHRDHQAALGVHRDAQVLGVVVGDGAAAGVDDGVELGVGLERLDGGQREERQERQLDALAGLERGLGPVAQPGDGGDIGLDHGGQLGRGLQRLDHALGDDLPGAGHPLGGAAQARLGDRGPGPAPAGVRLGGLAGRRRAGACRARRRPGRGGRPRGGRRAGSGRAASSTSCLRIRPPTPVPVTPARSMPCSAASLRTSGVTYGLSSRWRRSWRPAPPRARRPRPAGAGAGAAGAARRLGRVRVLGRRRRRRR